jgi:uncharacterized protein YkwD
MTRSKGHARRYAVAALAAVGALAVAPASASATCHNKYAHPSQLSKKTVKQTTLCLLNRQRKMHGRRALKPNKRLARAARKHARDMVRRNYFSHDSLGGGTFVDRIRRTGYLNGASRWTVGENLAWGTRGSSAPRAITQMWMNSSGHRANILSASFREVGIGLAMGAPGAGDAPAATYATDFGSKS